ncbi:MAG TPA: glycosyltransferase family 2 protein [Nocardioides sp.]|nr:glycosyltransferase family 2 protein [Nocardioides sp.]
MVRNEGAMLRRWVDHYGGALGHDHLLVLDDSSDDGSTDAPGCAVQRVPTITGHFERERMRIVSAAAAKLLRKHDAVVFADADEFIVADPDRYDGLAAAVAAGRGRAALGVLGLNVVHHAATEPAFDLNRPLFEQRSLLKMIPLLCKPSIKLVPGPWAAGSHGLRGNTFEIDPGLYMFHLKFADRDHLMRVAEHRRAMVTMDGRAEETSWRFTGDEMVALLDRITADLADPASVPEFNPVPDQLAKIVQTFDNGVTRATGRRQVQAMEARPFRRIPARFSGVI